MACAKKNKILQYLNFQLLLEAQILRRYKVLGPQDVFLIILMVCVFYRPEWIFYRRKFPKFAL